MPATANNVQTAAAFLAAFSRGAEGETQYLSGQFEDISDAASGMFGLALHLARMLAEYTGVPVPEVASAVALSAASFQLKDLQ